MGWVHCFQRNHHNKPHPLIGQGRVRGNISKKVSPFRAVTRTTSRSLPLPSMPPPNVLLMPHTAQAYPTQAGKQHGNSG